MDCVDWAERRNFSPDFFLAFGFDSAACESATLSAEGF